MKPVYFAVIGVGLLGVAFLAACVALDRFELSGSTKPRMGAYDVAAAVCFTAAIGCMAKFGGLL